MRCRGWCGALLLSGLGVAGGLRVAAADNVSVALDPPLQVVALGDTVRLSLDVTQAGLAFNAFDAVIGYDPAVLTFLPTAPTSQQEGVYMKGACGNTFHLFSAAADSLSITDVLLCNGVSLTGPGQLYKLRFRAIAPLQVTPVRIRSIQFYNAGHFVDPDSTNDAIVSVGVALDAAAPPLRAVALAVRPNPCTTRAVIEVRSPTAGEQRLDVTDVQGRTVRCLEAGSFPAGIRTVRWDARDAQGVRLAPGIYFIRLHAGRSLTQTRVALVN